MPCGHTCPSQCGLDCPDKCPHPCPKKLHCGHPCPNICGLDCPTECLSPCSEKLPCGHPCPSTCGLKCPTKCFAKCTRILVCGHRCDFKCHNSETPCRDPALCKIPVHVSLPKCDHKIRMICKDNPENNTTKDYPECTENCKRPLKCGHKCPNRCAEPCETKCRVKVEKEWTSCGHNVVVECFEYDTIICQQPCSRDLSCGHRCTKPCGERCNTLESKCNQRCQKELRCGHQCQEKCGEKCTRICKVKVPKTMPSCEHSQMIPCGVDPAGTSCKGKCTKIFTPCGHKCKKTCGEVCGDVCSTIIKEKREDCCHLKEVVCGASPIDAKCRKPCVKILSKCKHKCPNKCCEPCTKICKVKVMKKHPICQHEVEVECHEDPVKIVCQKSYQKALKCGHEVEIPCKMVQIAGVKCQKRCEKELKCGHVCQKICGAPCTSVCEEIVIKILPGCNHPVQLPCHADSKIAFCKQLCGERLGCGHVCQNPCGENCHKDGNGQKYREKCHQSCNKVLMCGHQCLSKCKDCLGGRFHEPCQVAVHDVKLTCGCLYSGACSKLASARHCEGSSEVKKLLNPARSDTQRFCVLVTIMSSTHEVADPCKHIQNPKPGEFCDEPCDQILPCNHQCIGLCGEPCPDLCRFCDRLTIMSTHSELQMTNHDSQYLKLQQCGHVAEVNDLKRKIHAMGSGGCKPILPITCPSCSQPLTHRRFVQHTSSAQRLILQILNEINTIETANVEEVQHTLSQSEYRFKSVTTTSGSGRSRRTVTREVVRRPHPESAWTLAVLKRLEDFQMKIRKLLVLCKDVNIERFKEQIDSLRETTDCLQEILGYRVPLTKQIAHDLYNEIVRAHLCEVLLRELSIGVGGIRRVLKDPFIETKR